MSAASTSFPADLSALSASATAKPMSRKRERRPSTRAAADASSPAGMCGSRNAPLSAGGAAGANALAAAALRSAPVGSLADARRSKASSPVCVGTYVKERRQFKGVARRQFKKLRAFPHDCVSFADAGETHVVLVLAPSHTTLNARRTSRTAGAARLGSELAELEATCGYPG